MTSTPGPGQEPSTRGERELVAEIGRWVLSVLRTDPGWDTMVTEFKPQADRVYLRVVEDRGGTAIPGATGPVKQDSPVLAELEELQRSCHLRGRGSWFSVTVTITATGWPDPAFRTSAAYNFRELPHRYGQEAPYSGQDVLAHLEKFPRTRARTPQWAVSLAEQDGRHPEFVEPAEGESTETGDVHPGLRAAAAGHAAHPGDKTMAAVLREAMNGVVLLDISGSDLVPGPDGQPVGPESQIRVQTLGQRDGGRALAIYTAADQAKEMFRRRAEEQQDAEPVLLREPAASVLDMVVRDRQYDALVVDPAGEHSVRIPREQLEWLMRMPRNQAVKNALLQDSVPGVLAALLDPEGQLLLGTREHEGQAMPVMVQPAEPDTDPDTLMVFTSAAEIAALDPGLQVRSASSRTVLRFALDAGAAAVRINAMAPVATIPAGQLRELLELAAEGDGPGPGETREHPGGGENG